MKDLGKVLAAINEMGEGLALSGTQLAKLSEGGVFSSGSPLIDGIFGGGLYQGHIMEVYGPPECGKTTLALRVLSNWLKTMGKPAVFYDAENRASEKWFRANGVDINNPNFVYVNGLAGETSLQVVGQLLDTEALVIVDSVAAISALVDLEKDYGQSTMGTHAKIVKEFVRKSKATMASNGSKGFVLIVNHENVPFSSFGPSYPKSSGGDFAKYLSSFRVRLTRVSTTKQTSKGRSLPIRHKIKIATKRNVFGPANLEGETFIDLRNGVTGWDYLGEIIEACLDEKLLTKKGNSYSISQGKTKFEGTRLELIKLLKRGNTALGKFMEQQAAEIYIRQYDLATLEYKDKG